MLVVRTEETDNCNIIEIIGRLDSNSVGILENALRIIELDNIRVDCKDLEYISSAGLRVLLRLKKESQHMEVINVKDLIYQIFEVTGFDSILDIKKENE